MIVASGTMLSGAVVKDGTPFGPTVAASVQGLGAIWAILGAAWIADRQANAQDRRRLHALAGVLSMGLELVQKAFDAVSHEDPVVTEDYVRSFTAVPFRLARDIIAQVPLHEMATADLAVGTHNLIEALKTVEERIFGARQGGLVTIDLDKAYALTTGRRSRPGR